MKSPLPVGLRMMPAEKLFVIGTDMQWEEEQILSAGKGYDLECVMLLASDISIRLQEHDADALYKGSSIRALLQKGSIIFRRTRDARDRMIVLALLADRWSIPHTDSILSIATNLNKFLSIPQVPLQKISHVPTIFLDQENHPENIAFPFPILAKPVDGRHGEEIEIFHGAAALETFLARTDRKHMMLQPFLSIEEEYRVFVIGNSSPGIIKKIPQKGSRIANYAAGASFVPAGIPPDIEQESIDLCISCGIDVGGVDIARIGNTYYLLEINRCPEFRAFSSAMNMNVAEKIVAYLAGK